MMKWCRYSIHHSIRAPAVSATSLWWPAPYRPRKPGNALLMSASPFDRRYRLAPVYDMLPMRFRPRDEDPSPVPGFTPPAPHAGVLEVWARAKDMARDYWALVRSHDAISPEFRAMVAAFG